MHVEGCWILRAFGVFDFCCSMRYGCVYQRKMNVFGGRTENL